MMTTYFPSPDSQQGEVPGLQPQVVEVTRLTSSLKESQVSHFIWRRTCVEKVRGGEIIW